MNNLTILGVFYEGYKDMWIDFISLLKKNWPDCPYRFFIVSNGDREDSICGIKVLNAGLDAEYSLKIQTALKEIKTDYVLILLEDFFISKSVDTRDFQSLLQYISDNQINYYSMPMKGFHNTYVGKRNFNRKGEKMISENAEYTLTCQPSIWKKDFLTSCIGKENYNAWIFEGIFSSINKELKRKYVEKCVVSINNPLSILHGAIQGKLIPTTFEILQSYGYQMKSKRELLTKKEFRKISLKIKLRSFLPLFFQRLVKKIFRPATVFKKYENEINLIIKSRWGN